MMDGVCFDQLYIIPEIVSDIGMIILEHENIYFCLVIEKKIPQINPLSSNQAGCQIPVPYITVGEIPHIIFNWVLRGAHTYILLREREVMKGSAGSVSVFLHSCERQGERRKTELSANGCQCCVAGRRNPCVYMIVYVCVCVCLQGSCVCDRMHV